MVSSLTTKSIQPAGNKEAAEELLDARAILAIYYQSKDTASSNATVYNAVLRWASMWMDFYNVARFFRSYKTSRNGYPTEPARKILTYYGDAHCSSISAFLSTLPDFVKVSRSESMASGKDFQCLKLNTPVPLFGGKETGKGPWKIDE